MSVLNLTKAPESFHFQAHEHRELIDMLMAIDKDTLITPVIRVKDDLELNQEGTTANGYSYSDNALTQLCSLVAPGLIQYVLEVSGQLRKPTHDRRFYSSELAIETFNRSLKLRFEKRLIGLQLVRNTKTKIIDGLVGARYRFLSNLDFMQRTTQTLRQLHVMFMEAFLYGRQLVLRYIEAAPKYKLCRDDYSTGINFANSEIGGRSVRAAGLIVRTATHESALTPFTGGDGGRVVHSGRDFERKLHGLLEGTINKMPTGKQIDEANLQRRLELGDNNHQKRIKQILTALVRRKLTQSFAKRVISSACALGSDGRDTLVDALPGEQALVLSRRTVYDLFTALIREAKQLPIDTREVAEQCAYSMLIGKVQI